MIRICLETNTASRLAFDDAESIKEFLRISSVPIINNVYRVYRARNPSLIIEELAFKTVSPLPDLINLMHVSKRIGLLGQISERLGTKLKNMIYSISSVNVWPELAAKPDYNACIFETRKFPYFTVESKTWSAAVLNINEPAEYTPSLTRAVAQAVAIPDNLADADDEKLLTIATQNHNYTAIMRTTKYSRKNHLESLASMCYIDRNFGLYYAKYLLQNYAHFHVIYSPAFWKIIANFGLQSDIQHAFWYAMYLAKQEETIIGNHITISSRVIFRLDAANMIPNIIDDLENSPFVIHINEKKIDQQVPFYLHDQGRNRRKINSTDEFNRRFKIATGGAFSGINLRDYQAAITGSILIPCVHSSPLEEGFNGQIETLSPYDYTGDFDRYLEYYYPSYRSLSDSDYIIMSRPPSDTVRNAGPEDLNQSGQPGDQPGQPGDQPGQPGDQPGQPGDQPGQPANTELKNIADNLQDLTINSVIDSYEDEANPPKVKPVAKPIEKPIEPDFNLLSDIDISITTRDFGEFQSRVRRIYEKIKDNCAGRGPVYLSENRRIATTAFRIHGPGIIRPVDLFMISYPPIEMVKKFHLPCVKMYYDGELIMLSSCLSALLSGINYQYKWFSCNKVAGDIILKYCNRGITTILNPNELKALAEYVRTSSRWETISNRFIVGALPHSDTFFTSEIGCRRGLRKLERYVEPTKSRLSLPPTAAQHNTGKYVIAPNL